MTNHPQKGCSWALVTHFCMCNCWLTNISPLHAVNWDQQCRRRRTSVACTYGLQRYTKMMLYTKAQGLIVVYLLQTSLYNTSTTNRPSRVWALSYMYALITNTKVREAYTRSTAPLQEPACHTGSHRVTCHPAEAASPALIQAVITAGTQFIHQLRMKGWVNQHAMIFGIRRVLGLSCGGIICVILR